MQMTTDTIAETDRRHSGTLGVRPGSLLPDATRTYEDWERARHLDLPRLDVEDLLAELALVRDAWASRTYYRTRRESVYLGALESLPARDWLRERGERLRGELQKRRR
jgi:hypothetical protein